MIGSLVGEKEGGGRREERRERERHRRARVRNDGG